MTTYKCSSQKQCDRLVAALRRAAPSYYAVWRQGLAITVECRDDVNYVSPWYGLPDILQEYGF